MYGNVNRKKHPDGGYAFTMDGEEFKKRKNMAFFHSPTEENYDAIKKLIRSELGEY